VCVWEREIVTELRFTQRVNFTSILFSIWFGISTCNLKWKTFEKIGNSFTYIFNHKPVVIFKVKSHTNSDFWLIEFYTVSTCGCMSFTEGSRFNVNFFCISLGIWTWIWKGKSLTLQNVNSINCWRKWMSEWVLLTGGSEFHFFFAGESIIGFDCSQSVQPQGSFPSWTCQVIWRLLRWLHGCAIIIDLFGNKGLF